MARIRLVNRYHLLTVSLALMGAAANAVAATPPPMSFFARRDILPTLNLQEYSAMAVADFNGDGRPDIALLGFGTLNVMLSTGDFTYTVNTYIAPAEAEGITVGDFNNDGHVDIAATGVDALSGVDVYINQGDGTFRAPVNYPTGESNGVAAADMNGDGVLDLVGDGFIMLGVGDGTFEPPAPLVTFSARPVGQFRRTSTSTVPTSDIGSTVAVADLNGDGIPDLVYVTDLEVIPIPTVLLGNGNGTFRPGGSLSEVEAFAVAIGDFNGDGIPDLAFALTSGNVGICIGKGNGDFKPMETIQVSNFAGQSIAVADLNGDGIPDIAVADLNRGGESGALPSPIGVLYGEGNGKFRPLETLETIFPFGVTIADVNGDGRPDVLVPGGFSTAPYIFAFLGAANGKLQTAPPIAALATSPEVAVTGDFNGDGKLDMAVTGFASNNVSVLLGNGRGGFHLSATLTAGPSPDGIVAGDFNGDGKLDLAVVNNGLDNISIFLGNGNGTFGTATNFPAGQSPLLIATGDFNGDGHLDLAVTNGTGGNVSILLGKGDGTFTGPTDFPAGTKPVFLAVADLNADGKLDLAVGDEGSGTVSILFGNGDGTFRAPFPVATGGGSAGGIAIADFNGDGNPDLLVANLAGNNISVLPGNGTGGFGSPLVSNITDVSNIAGAPLSLVTGDFNGDGKLDVAVALVGLGDIGVMAGNGDGTFGVASLFGAGFQPVWISTGAFTGTNANDLMVVNAGDNTLSLMRDLDK